MFLEKIRLDGKLALITGASRGIGRSIALALAEAGADIAACSRKENPDLREQITAMGRRFCFIPCDLNVREQTRSLIPAVVEQMGHPDILVNNAGSLLRSRSAVEFKEEDWDTILELDLTAPYILSLACAEHWLSTGSRGKIINIISVMGLSGGAGSIGYAAAKHGLCGLTKSLANEWAASGINVNGIAPGFVRSDMTRGLHTHEGRSQKVYERIPCRRWGEPEDIAGGVLYLASELADYVHGSIYTLDGGYESM